MISKHRQICPHLIAEKGKEYLLKVNVKVHLPKGSATSDEQHQFVWILMELKQTFLKIQAAGLSLE